MGTVYAIANQKGGVGKTTTAVNVGGVHRGGWIRDAAGGCRPAGERHVGLGIARARRPGLYEVLAGEATAAEALAATPMRGLTALPAGPGLAGANIELPRMDGLRAAAA